MSYFDQIDKTRIPKHEMCIRDSCIIVRHGNYYTFYGNIQSIYVKQGDTVKTGQSLGKVYTDPDTGYSQMHFQLWQGTNKMNPEPWLR